MGVFGKGVERVCAVIAAGSLHEAKRQLRAAVKRTPTIELRLDWLKSDRERRSFLSWLGLSRRNSAYRRARFVATCRREEAGGRFRGSVEQELGWLQEATRAGCTWWDLEIETARRLRLPSLVGR